MVCKISERVSPEHLDVIERGLFNSWSQHGPVHKGFLSFGNVICLLNYEGVATVEKVEEGIELTHRLEGVYKGLWPHDSNSDFLTEDNKRKIIYTDDFDGYRISDSRPGELVLLQGEIQVPHKLGGFGLDLAVEFAAVRLCEKLGAKADEFLAN